ncbi:acyloxyacyl hydrolase [Parasedimentitalea huanghaiensis]|uniref:Acyloxyacyl hydrolase n=1 Tax=Parasedimentitalea huanghaiensis TaxID=2682100 RepID=A0A6L6WKB0_9RHOB|nr:acyloxyacyl hydrolase [Zongyanglinia huanghaiensis]MVO18273.1 acyloxyacyl hydrolase [Zongyanglinia huanghaiensis]
MKKLLSFALFLSFLSPAYSQEWVVGSGFADFSNGQSKDTAIISAEYHSAYFHRRKRLELGWGAAVSVFGTGDVHLGGGLVGTVDLGHRWFGEVSVMPGVYAHRKVENDLGSAFEIRSLVSVGRRLKNGSAVSVALTHKSNASTATNNPGVNALLVRWHLPIER